VKLDENCEKMLVDSIVESREGWCPPADEAAAPKLPFRELSAAEQAGAWTEVMSKRSKRSQRRQKATWRGLNPLQTCYPEGVKKVGDGDWEEVEFAVDSGATETVVSEKMLSSVETKESWGSRQGVNYKVANGTKIPNEGEKTFCAVTSGGIGRKVKAQVCDVDTALMSVKKIVTNGNRVVFDDESYIEDKVTGERMMLEERGGMYMLKLWAKGDF